MTVLPVEEVACPMCGARECRDAFEAPAQLIDLDQTFVFVRCAACDLVYLRQRVTSECLGSLYDADYPLHKGPALWGPFAPLVEQDQARLDAARVALVRAHRRIGPDDTVFDVGCGRPTFLEAMRRETGCTAVGVDVVTPAHDERFQDLAVLQGMPPCWPSELLAHAPFSAVTLWHYLEHDPAPIDTLSWLRERMRPDGVAIVEVPDFTGSTVRILGRWWPGLHTPRHASLFTPATLGAAAERSGWRVLRHTRSGTLAPFVLVALGVLDRMGFRFGRHPAAAVFPFWAMGMAVTWPWLGRPSREGRGLQTIVLTP